MNKLRLVGLVVSGLFFTALFVVLLFGDIIFADSAATITIGTDAAYPPFETTDKLGEYRGYDIEIAEAVCGQMNVTCKFVNDPFNMLIPNLLQKKYDAVISAMGATDERKVQVSFSDIYYVPTASYLAPLAKNYSMGDIVGKTIAVQKDSTFEDYLRNHKYGNTVNVKPEPDFPTAIADLQAGRVDIFLSDTLTVKAWLRQDDNSKTYGIVVGPMINAKYFGDGFAFAFRKDEDSLRDAVNKALATIKANGTYDRITKKYFGDLPE